MKKSLIQQTRENLEAILNAIHEGHDGDVDAFRSSLDDNERESFQRLLEYAGELNSANIASEPGCY